MSATGELIPRGRFKPGPDPRRSRNGGRSKGLIEIQTILEKEHRVPSRIREIFNRLRALALGEVVEVTDKKTGKVIGIQLQADPRFMDLYLERVFGPVTNETAVRAQARALLDEMMAEARERRAGAEVVETTAVAVVEKGGGDGG